MNILSGRQQLAPRPHWSACLRSLVGGTISIAILIYLSQHAGQIWIMAPFGASCVLLYAASQSPLAQPRNLIFGHMLSATIGLIMLKFWGVNMFSIALAVGLSIALMQVFQCVHPPAGANPLVILLTAHQVHYDWSFLIFPVLMGALVLVFIASVVNNIGRGAKWPLYGLAVFKDQ